MLITVSVGPDDHQHQITCTVEDDDQHWTPELIEEHLTRAARTALSTWREATGQVQPQPRKP